MSRLEWLFRWPFLVLLSLVLSAGCGEPESDGEEAVTGGAFALTANAVAFEVVDLPGTPVAGAPATMTVRAVDAAGLLAAEYTGTVHFASANAGDVLPADTTFQAADAGVRGFSFTLFAAGARTLVATDVDVASITGSASVVVVAAEASHYHLTGLAAAPAAGVATTFNVAAMDPWDNPASTYAGTGVVRSSDLAALLPAPRVFSAGATTGVPITFVKSGAQTVTVTDAAAPSITGTASTTVTAQTNSAITAPANVSTGATGLAASTTSWSGATYTWTAHNGAITAGQGTRQVTFSAGSPGTLTLGVIAVKGAGVRTGNKSVPVAALPQTPTITAATAVSPSSTGNTATVVAVTGMKYTWTVASATITSSGGAAGVTSGGVNKITYTAASSGPVVLSVVEKNAAGATSPPASVSLPVIANSPKTPAITATSPVTEGTPGRTASVVARAGFGYLWSIAGGTITSAGGTAGVTAAGRNKITYSAGPVGTIAFTCRETNGTHFSAPATKSVVAVAAPQVPVVVTTSPVGAGTAGLTASVLARDAMTYAWTIANGTLTSAASGVTAGGVNTVTFTSGVPGTLVLGAVEINVMGVSSAPGSAAVTVLLAAIPPVQPTIVTASPIAAGQASTASVTARPGVVYAWTLTGGTITSPGGAEGVTAGGLNTVSFAAGPPGTLNLGCAETTSLGTSAPGLATVVVTEALPAVGDMYFVAHQDDDLLFLNPDIERSIQAGRPTQTVFVTAGDPGDCQPCWEARENGVWNAHAAMANAVKDWTCTPRVFHGKTVSSCVLDTAPHVSVVFLRLPDGGLSSLWATEEGSPFWVTPVASLTSVDGAYSVTRAEVITLIYDMIADFHPALVGTQDGTLAYGEDHQDHMASALMVLEASFRVTDPLAYRIFRGYNVYGNWFTIPSPEPENLSPAEYAEKVRIMEAYAGGFPVDSDFDHWCHRRYAISRVESGTGLLVTPGGACLATQGGSGANGAPVEIHPCDGSAGQLWSVTAAGAVARVAGRCLTITGSGAAVLGDCGDAPAQRFKLFANGQLRTQGARCLTVGWDGASVAAEDCDADRTTEKYVPLPTQRFTLRFGASSRWSEGTDFSDADVGSWPSYYGTFRLGRIDANGRADAFVRRSAGVATAEDEAPGFDELEVATGVFSDAAGWWPPPYGTTVQLGDVNGDGRADACGRNSVGIACATGLVGGGFAPVTQWSTDFGDATFGGAAYYPSVRLGDIDGDGYADVCGRASTGIFCARNDKAGSFSAATAWLAGDFTDAGGWSADAQTRTLRLGDVNGDGRADVCLRGSAGVRCAISNGVSAFTDAHLWSFRAEWSDAAGWGASAGHYASLDLGDVNGDAKADLCGRAPTGLVCALSNGIGFEAAMPSMPLEYTDALGWDAEPYGASLRLGDLDGDGRSDVCGRDGAGLLCALAP